MPPASAAAGTVFVGATQCREQSARNQSGDNKPEQPEQPEIEIEREPPSDQHAEQKRNLKCLHRANKKEKEKEEEEQKNKKKRKEKRH